MSTAGKAMHGKSALGSAWRGMAWHGIARQARHGITWHLSGGAR